MKKSYTWLSLLIAVFLIAAAFAGEMGIVSKLVAIGALVLVLFAWQLDRK